MKRGRRAVADEIASLSAQLAVTALDLVVLVGGITGSLILCGPRGKDLYASKKVDRALQFAEEIFQKYRESRFRQALSRAVQSGFIERVKSNTYRLTVSGKQRFSDLLPTYKRPRPWDRRLWLVTYDIPESKRKKRNQFRAHLMRVGCRMIQESVWLSVKDPREWLLPLVDGFRMKGKVLISCLGKNGSIGEEDIAELICRLFDVSNLNRRYKKWMVAVERTPEEFRYRHLLSYFGILRDDPILPKELLPDDWLGNEARAMFVSHVLPAISNESNDLSISNISDALSISGTKNLL